MGVRFADGTALAVWDVMSEDDVVERELDCGAMGEVGDYERGGDTSVLVQDEQVGDARAVRALNEVWQDGVAPVEPDREREEQAELLGELVQPARRRARRRDEEVRVDDPRAGGVLVVVVVVVVTPAVVIVTVTRGGAGIVGPVVPNVRLVELEVCTQADVVCNVFWQGLCCARESVCVWWGVYR